MTTTTAPSPLDVLTEPGRVCHLPCGDEADHPDTPSHALCGQPLLNIEAPPSAPRCKTCTVRAELAGGPFAFLLGLPRCEAHGGTR